MLQIFTTNNTIDIKTKDLIHPDFDYQSFDFHKPHTMVEWQCYFFATNPECKLIDKTIDNPIARTNLHTGAFTVYLKKKIEKGLVKGINEKKGFKP